MNAQKDSTKSVIERIETATHEELTKFAIGVFADLLATDSASNAETVRREIYSNFDNYLK